MDAQLMFTEHHNRCMKNLRAAEERLWSLTRMHGVVPACAQAVMVGCIEAITLYRCELWWDPKE